MRFLHRVLVSLLVIGHCPAQNVRILDATLDHSNLFSIEATADYHAVLILQRSDNDNLDFSSSTPIDMALALPNQAKTFWDTEASQSQRGFYLVQGFEADSHEADTDGDGIKDRTELQAEEFLDPIDGADAIFADVFDIGPNVAISQDFPGEGAGKIEGVDRVDIYRFQGTVGDELFFDEVRASKNLDSHHYKLVDPYGQVVKTGSFRVSNMGAVTLDRTGEYALVVGDSSITGTGAYSINLLNTVGTDLDPDVAAYASETGISVSAAAKIDNMLADIRAAGVEPALMWVGGTDYNTANQTECVIGGSGSVVGSGSTFTASPVGVQFNSGKYLRFANPAAVKGPKIDNYFFVTIFAKTSDGVKASLAGSFDGTSGSGINIISRGNARLQGFIQNAGDVGGNPRMSFAHNQPRQNIDGWTAQSFHIRPSGAKIISSAEMRNTGHNWVWPVNDQDFWNDNDWFYIGNNGSGKSSQAHNNKIAFILVGTSASLIHAEGNGGAVAQNAPFYRGMVNDDEPIVVYTGDSHVASSFGFPEFVNGTDSGVGLASGGQWTGKHIVWDNGWGGANTSFFESKYDSFVRAHMKRRGGAGMYFVLVVEDTDGLTFAERVANENPDVDMVICSYMGGEAAQGDALAESAEALAVANGWPYVPFHTIAHNAINDGGWGTYGYFIGNGSSHSTPAGRRIKAQYFAAAVPHPTNTAAPRFDLANPPTITGVASVGDTLTCDPGIPHVAPDNYEYQWMANLTEISGATSSTYVLTASEENKFVSCRVTAVKTGQNSAEFTADPTGKIAASP